METWKNFAFKRSSVKKTLPKGKVNHGNLKKLWILAELFKKKIQKSRSSGGHLRLLIGGYGEYAQQAVQTMSQACKHSKDLQQ